MLITRKAFLRGGAAAAGTLALAGPVRAAARAQVHVAPHGDDTNPGTLARPLRTLAAARAAARRAAPATVVLADGVYEGGLTLSAADSGSQWVAAPGARPYLTNARRIAPTDFHKVSDPATLARIAPELRDRIVALDLRAMGFTNIARFADLFNDNGGIVELFADRARMPIARYPSNGYMTMKTVLVHGGGQEVGGDWRAFYDPGGAGKQAVPRPGVFVYRDDRTARWVGALPKGVWLKGYWRIPWQNEAIRVAAIDTEKRTITLAAPAPGGGIGNKYVRPGGDGREQYYLLNLLEELDQPGEWCIDFDSATLFFYPPRPLDQINLRIADDKRPVILVQDASDVLLSGLEIGETLGDGIRIERGQRNRVAGCQVANTTHYGVRLDGGTAHEALSNDVHDTGAGGIWLGGGAEGQGGRRPAGHRAVNNHIWNFGVIERVYAPGINCGFSGGGAGGHHTAVGMYVANNLIHDGPHAGILHGSWDNVFEYNEIYRYCSVSNDMGAIYCYDRYERSGNRTLRNNFFHNSPIGDGIYFDGDNRNDLVEGNIAWKVGGTAFLYKRAFTAPNPLLLRVVGNVAFECGTGYRFVARKGSDIARNIAVACRKPFDWIVGKQVMGPDAEGDVSSGPNIAYAADPGFAAPARHDFSLSAGSQAARDVAARPIPVARIGLYLDDHRRHLPDPAVLRRWDDPDPALRVSYAIRDRG